MTETWIIAGATSAIARAFARQLSGEGADLILAGRDMAELERSAQDCVLRGASGAACLPLDTGDPQTFSGIVEAARQRDGRICIAVFVASMPDQAEIDAEPGLAATTLTDGLAGPVELLLRLAPLMEERGSGTVIGVGSVAGDRGRLGNYVYGAGKAGFATFLAGLRNRLGRKGIHVMTVKPGFVDTAMTWGLAGLFLVAAPDDVARTMLAAARKGRNVVYTPWFWRWIMLIITHIPEFIFKRLRI